MNFGTVAKARVIFAFSVVLLLIALYIPDIGVWLALLWLAVVLWQYQVQRKDKS